MPTDPGEVLALNDLWDDLTSLGHSQWAESLRAACNDALQPDQHGMLSKWLDLVNQIPRQVQPDWRIADGRVIVAPEKTPDPRREFLQQFCPWRKGPWQIGRVDIDTEWRSDWKWDRIAEHVEWRERRVLDVGCGNGYFGWRMLEAGAQSVVGLDPFLLFVMQHAIVQRLAGDNRNQVLPLTDACLIPRLHVFDVAVSMGVLYHRTSPIDHLQVLRESLKSGGTLVLETLVIEQPTESVLVPEGRYAKMRNVWFIPSPQMLVRWLQRTGFRDIEIVDVTRTTPMEQNSTEWMTFESLPDFLDPDNPKRTIEGHPAPVRAMVTARRV